MLRLGFIYLRLGTKSAGVKGGASISDVKAQTSRWLLLRGESNIDGLERKTADPKVACAARARRRPSCRRPCVTRFKYHNAREQRNVRTDACLCSVPSTSLDHCAANTIQGTASTEGRDCVSFASKPYGACRSLGRRYVAFVWLAPTRSAADISRRHRACAPLRFVLPSCRAIRQWGLTRRHAM